MGPTSYRPHPVNQVPFLLEYCFVISRSGTLRVSLPAFAGTLFRGSLATFASWAYRHVFH